MIAVYRRLQAKKDLDRGQRSAVSLAEESLKESLRARSPSEFEVVVVELQKCPECCDTIMCNAETTPSIFRAAIKRRNNQQRTKEVFNTSTDAVQSPYAVPKETA